MNTVPYTNARREGRTNPGLIEFIGENDVRNPRNQPIPQNRKTRRANVKGKAIKKSNPARKVKK